MRERNRKPLKLLRLRNMHTDVQNLHATIMSLDSWAERFRTAGMNVVIDRNLLHDTL